MNDIKILKLKDSKEWQYYFKLIPAHNRDIYFLPEFYELYKVPDYKEPECFVYLKGKTVVLFPYLKKKIMKGKYQLDKDYYDLEGVYGYNGAIYTEFNEEIKKDFFLKFDKYCLENNIVAEFFRNHPVLQNEIFFKGYRNVKFDRKVVVNLYSEKEKRIVFNYRSDVKNKLNKARRKKITIKESDGVLEDIKIFYKYYNEAMAHKKSREELRFDLNYFMKLCKNFNNKILFAIKDNRILAGLIFIYSDHIGSIHLSWRTQYAGNLGANHLLRDYVIRELSQRLNLKIIFHGGGNTDDENDSLFKFKKGFSDTTRDFYIITKIHNQKVYDYLCQRYENAHKNINSPYKNYFLKYHY